MEAALECRARMHAAWGISADSTGGRPPFWTAPPPQDARAPLQTVHDCLPALCRLPPRLMRLLLRLLEPATQLTLLVSAPRLAARLHALALRVPKPLDSGTEGGSDGDGDGGGDGGGDGDGGVGCRGEGRGGGESDGDSEGGNDGDGNSGDGDSGEGDSGEGEGGEPEGEALLAGLLWRRWCEASRAWLLRRFALQRAFDGDEAHFCLGLYQERAPLLVARSKYYVLLTCA